MNSEVLAQFIRVAGKAGVITNADELRTYECDGLMKFPCGSYGSPAAHQYRTGAGHRPNLPCVGYSVCRSWFGYRALRRSIAGCERHRNQPRPHESYFGSRLHQRSRGGRTRCAERERDGTFSGAGYFSTQFVVADRCAASEATWLRARGRALPQVWIYDHSRPRAGSSDAGWFVSTYLGTRRVMLRATT